MLCGKHASYAICGSIILCTIILKTTFQFSTLIKNEQCQEHKQGCWLRHANQRIDQTQTNSPVQIKSSSSAVTSAMRLDSEMFDHGDDELLHVLAAHAGSFEHFRVVCLSLVLVVHDTLVGDERHGEHAHATVHCDGRFRHRAHSCNPISSILHVIIIFSDINSNVYSLTCDVGAHRQQHSTLGHGFVGRSHLVRIDTFSDERVEAQLLRCSFGQVPQSFVVRS